MRISSSALKRNKIFWSNVIAVPQKFTLKKLRNNAQLGAISYQLNSWPTIRKWKQHSLGIYQSNANTTNNCSLETIKMMKSSISKWNVQIFLLIMLLGNIKIAVSDYNKLIKATNKLKGAIKRNRELYKLKIRRNWKVKKLQWQNKWKQAKYDIVSHL